jgi:hypothetical protein|tara:strand:+ start:303 stop:455 length:153 start_codon:yes stop_codon:yes gene_type:complete
LQLGVAKELGYTLSKLMREVTLEELMIWSTYFGVLNEEQEAEMKRAKRRR